MASSGLLSHSAVREYAQMVGDHHEIWDESGLADVYGLIEKLGGTVTRGDTPVLLHVVRKREFQVWEPTMTSDRRRRFTATAAVGRYFLDYLYAKRVGELTVVHEQQGAAMVNANVFAATLLMPARQFAEAWANHAGDDWAVAAQFDVSPLAARTRAEVLDLTPVGGRI